MPPHVAGVSEHSAAHAFCKHTFCPEHVHVPGDCPQSEALTQQCASWQAWQAGEPCAEEPTQTGAASATLVSATLVSATLASASGGVGAVTELLQANREKRGPRVRRMVDATSKRRTTRRLEPSGRAVSSLTPKPKNDASLARGCAGAGGARLGDAVLLDDRLAFGAEHQHLGVFDA